MNRSVLFEGLEGRLLLAADLTASLQSYQAGTYNVGDVFLVEQYVTNEGADTAWSDHITAIGLSPDRIWGNAGDVSLATYRNNAGQATTVAVGGTTGVAIPAGTPDGMYYLVVIADAGNYEIEDDEFFNNYAWSNGPDIIVGTPAIPFTDPSGQTGSGFGLDETDRPDLEATLVIYQAGFYDPGDSFLAYQSVENVGGLETPGPYHVVAILSADRSWDATDYVLYTARMPAPQGANAIVEGQFLCMIPPEVPDGMYYLALAADPANDIAELDEVLNNYAWSNGPDIVVGTPPVPITDPSAETPFGFDPDDDDRADLDATLLSFEAGFYSPGDSFFAYQQVTNVGGVDTAGPYFVAAILSADRSWDATDYLLYMARMPGPQGADAVVEGQFQCTIPAEVPTGMYYLAFAADPANYLAEMDEVLNNYSWSESPSIFVGMQVDILNGVVDVPFLEAQWQRGGGQGDETHFNFGFDGGDGYCDLEITVNSYDPGPYTAGQQFTANITVDNIGEDVTQAPYWMFAFLTADQVLDANDYVVWCDWDPGPLAGTGTGGDPVGGDITCVVPLGVPAGNYYFTAWVDPANFILENDDVFNNHNCSASPDFIVGAGVVPGGLQQGVLSGGGTPSIQVGAGETQEIVWYSTDPNRQADIWAFGPQGWRKVFEGVTGSETTNLWDTGAAAAGWYLFAAETEIGGQTQIVSSRQWVEILRPAGAQQPEEPAPTIALLSPFPGEQADSTQPFEIRWQANLSAGQDLSVFVWARDETTDWFPISGAVSAAAESYTWDLAGSAIQPGRYLLSLHWLDGSALESATSADWLVVA